MPATTPPSLTLQSVSGLPIPSVALEPGAQITIGRASTQTVRLEDPSVSRRHARLAFENGQWRLSDLGSRHGTFLNGIRLEAEQPAEVGIGDRVRIGPWTLAILSRDRRPSSLISLDDTQRRVESVTSYGREEIGSLAERRLALLMNSARTIHDATDEDSVFRGIVKSLVDGTGFGRAALVRPMRGFEEVEVLASASAPSSRVPRDEFCPSRTLLQGASQGRIVRMDEEPALQQAQSIIQLGIAQAICAPIFVGETIDCYAYIDSHSPAERMHKDAMAFCGAMADLGGLALANLRRHALEIRQRQLLRDLEAARDVQRRLMPPDAGCIGVARYRVHLQSGRHVAGDLFGIVNLDDNRAAVFLGDVSGKGIAAAILMASVQTHLAATLRLGADVVEGIATVNDFIAAHSAEREFVTLFIALIDARNRTITCVDAGHGYAALVRPGGVVERLNVGGGVPIGVERASVYTSSVIPIEPGTRLVLFSDGIPEQQSPEGEEFGFARVIEKLAASPDMATDLGSVTSGLKAFAETEAFADDVTLASIEPVL